MPISCVIPLFSKELSYTLLPINVTKLKKREIIMMVVVIVIVTVVLLPWYVGGRKPEEFFCPIDFDWDSVHNKDSDLCKFHCSVAL